MRHCMVAPMPLVGGLVGRTTLADLLGWIEAWLLEETATKFGCPRMPWVVVENDGDSWGVWVSRICELLYGSYLCSLALRTSRLKSKEEAKMKVSESFTDQKSKNLEVGELGIW